MPFTRLSDVQLKELVVEMRRRVVENSSAASELLASMDTEVDDNIRDMKQVCGMCLNTLADMQWLTLFLLEDAASRRTP